MAQKIQLGDGEDALLQVEGQAVGGEDGECVLLGMPRSRSVALEGRLMGCLYNITDWP